MKTLLLIAILANFVILEGVAVSAADAPAYANGEFFEFEVEVVKTSRDGRSSTMELLPGNYTAEFQNGNFEIDPRFKRDVASIFIPNTPEEWLRFPLIENSAWEPKSFSNAFNGNCRRACATRAKVIVQHIETVTVPERTYDDAYRIERLEFWGNNSRTFLYHYSPVAKTVIDFSSKFTGGDGNTVEINFKLSKKGIKTQSELQ